LSLFDQINGLRHTAMITNTPGGDIAELELRNRLHARVEDADPLLESDRRDPITTTHSDHPSPPTYRL